MEPAQIKHLQEAWAEFINSSFLALEDTFLERKGLEEKKNQFPWYCFPNSPCHIDVTSKVKLCSALGSVLKPIRHKFSMRAASEEKIVVLQPNIQY